MTDMWTLDPRIWQAIIGGGFLSAGWIFNGAQNRARDSRRRRERVKDVQTALIAEIGHYVQTLQLFDLNATWSRIVSAMEDDAHYIPVVPSERNDTIFAALLDEVHVLPQKVIDPVVGYYNQVFVIEAIIADLRSDQFYQMDQMQRIGIYTDYIALKKEALSRGILARAALRESLGIVPINSRDAVPSGQ